MIRSLPSDPVTISATANITMIMKAENPTTDFSFIELLSSNRCLKNSFMVVNLIVINESHHKSL